MTQPEIPPWETIIWDVCAAWLGAIVTQLEATTAGVPSVEGKPMVWVSPQNPAPVDSADMVATWAPELIPTVHPETGAILATRPTLIVRARVRRSISLPDPNAADGTLIDPIAMTRDAAVIFADHMAIARSVKRLPALLKEEIEAFALGLPSSDFALDQMVQTGEAGSWGTDAQIRLVLPVSLDAEC